MVAWNTNLVKKTEEPKQIEDLGDPKYKGRLVAEPRDYEFLMGIAKHKFKSDEKATALLQKIAANNVEFHKGHSQLTELLSAGQAALCVTCYAHQFPGRMKKGAPVNFLLSEGIGSINATAVFKDAPHPNAAMLFARWAASAEGQKVYAEGGRRRLTRKYHRWMRFVPKSFIRWELTISKNIPSTKRSGKKSSNSDRAANNYLMDKTEERLTSFACSLSFRDIEPPVLHALKRRFIDTIGCALGAFHVETSRIARNIASKVESSAKAGVDRNGTQRVHRTSLRLPIPL